MSGENLEFVAWATAASALVLSFVAVWPWFRRSLKHTMFADQVIKLCNAGNVDRARKLCSAAPDNPMVAATGKCLAALDEGGSEPTSETIARLRDLYHRSMKADLATAAKQFWIAIVVLVDVAVGVYLVMGLGAPGFTLALHALALLTLSRAYRLAKKMAVEGAEQGERLFPVIAAARKKAV
jgi:hypothetical protein